MSILGALFTLLPSADDQHEGDPGAEALERISVAVDYSELQAALSRLPSLSKHDWSRCQRAVSRRLAELAGM